MPVCFSYTISFLNRVPLSGRERCVQERISRTDTADAGRIPVKESGFPVRHDHPRSAASAGSSILRFSQEIPGLKAVKVNAAREPAGVEGDGVAAGRLFLIQQGGHLRSGKVIYPQGDQFRPASSKRMTVFWLKRIGMVLRKNRPKAAPAGAALDAGHAAFRDDHVPAVRHRVELDVLDGTVRHGLRVPRTAVLTHGRGRPPLGERPPQRDG